MKKRYYLRKTEKGFFYLYLGSETHGKPSHKIWVNSELISRDVETDEEKYYIEVPMQGVDITITKNGSKVLHPGDKNLFQILIPCGYRGESEYKFEPGFEPELELVFKIYHSPRGNLGIDTGAWVVTKKDKIKFKWQRWGRLYGAEPKGRTEITIDGTENDLPEEEELEDLL